ncbi:tRNA (adenine(22)-N(1))-methyltransferase [Staphylospora marina]|uniref:tRNA (adenine(22)-N(1))-methyltransferase n=1 Tax=Staphylospora marina TaxID=2490858 RepID=UPI001F14CC43|nr:class I SAM-dependent methyltransferase [Staphylospora marina]
MASMVPEGARLADIGADHAFLPIHLTLTGRIRFAVVGEVNRGPWSNALRRVQEAGLRSRIDVRLGDGLSVLRPGEADVVVIAGMGGTLMANLLEAGKDKLDGVRRLVLQPNIGGRRVREWLLEGGFTITAESLVEDAGILYEVIAAEPGDPRAPYEETGFPMSVLLEAGPVLCRDRHPLLPERFAAIVESKKKVADQLRRGKSVEAREKYERLESEIKEWERVIACLFGERK